MDGRSDVDHDLLIELKVKLEGLIEKVGQLTDDHEKRIRSLERWRWITVGMSTVVATIMGYVVRIFFH